MHVNEIPEDNTSLVSTIFVSGVWPFGIMSQF